MDRAKNPFSPGAGTPPPELAGRSSLLEDAMVALERVKNGRAEKSLMLVGLRGVGKTVLLREIEKLAEAAGYKVAFVETPENRQKKSLAEMLTPHLRRILFDLNRGADISEKARKGLRVLKSFMKGLKIKIGDLELYLDVDAETGEGDSGDLGTDLASLFTALAEAAKDRGTAIAIIVDEIQYLDETDLSALIMAVHHISQRSLPLILIGAGLPQLVGKSGNAKSYAERLFAFPEIGALDRESAFSALQAPAVAQGAKFTQDALDAIFTITKGYPYCLQEWAYHTWNIAPGPVFTQEDVRTATPRAIERLDEGIFRNRFDRLTPAEKQYARALADLGTTPQRSGDIASKLGKTVERVAGLRAQLIGKGMIYSPSHGHTAFTIPLFEEFLKRKIPVFSPSETY